MGDGNDGGPEVTYTLKEVLTEMNAKLDAALKGMHDKANMADVVDLKARMVLVEVFMKQEEKETAAKVHNREWLLPLVLSVAFLALGILGIFHL